MKFSNWTLAQLIEYLINCKSSPLLDYHNVTRCNGEIHLFNGERKDGKEEAAWLP
jgi:hypothetical protein